MGQCPQGHPNRPEARFCRACGTRLLDQPAVPVVPEPEPVAGSLPRARWTHASRAGAPRKEPRSAQVRGRSRRAAAVVGGVLLLVTGALGGMIVLRALDGPGAAACDAGVRWRQRSSPFRDGTAVGNTESNKVAVIQGGARVGFPNPGEFAALGYDEYLPIPEEELAALDTAPRDGLLFRERQFREGPGRLYYSAGGAVYQIRDETALLATRLDPATAIVIPAQGLDGAPRRPPTGTLLRLEGSRTTWVLDGGARRVATDVCTGARVNVLPADERALDDIPIVER